MSERSGVELPELGIGLLGCGTVGSSTVKLLRANAAELEVRSGARLVLRRVAVRDKAKARSVELDAAVVTTDAWDVVRDPNVHVVVETIGGVTPAHDLIAAAMDAGKHVVTANKELLSNHGGELLRRARSNNVDLLYEASVGGGIPILRPLKESMAGDRVSRIMGIINGTTNYILTRMSETGESFTEALREAQSLGYSELDPSADVDGYDAASKLAILASLAFGTNVTAADVHREGIGNISSSDITAARELGYEVKLVAIADVDGDEISARVHPAMLPRTHPLAAVRDVFNAIFVEADAVGELMFFGRGAGGDPTASAVVGDVVEVARNVVTGGRTPPAHSSQPSLRMRPKNEMRARFYAVLSVLDAPGVLAAVAGVFAANDISIASVRQEGFGDRAQLIVITHAASEGAHEATFRELRGLDAVKDVESTIRVVGTPEA